MSEQIFSTPGFIGPDKQYRLDRMMGVEDLYEVYIGADTVLDRMVTIRVLQRQYALDPKCVRTFSEEARIAAKLIHPNILRVYAEDMFQGHPFVAYEYATGGSLANLMDKTGGKIGIHRAMRICRQVANALSFAADNGVMHGNVTPNNIFFDAEGNVKLSGFIASALQKSLGEVVGTPYYIAPELIQAGIGDFRSDLYSLGGTLYHAITGKPPFEGANVMSVMLNRFENPPAKPSSLRPEVTEILDNFLLKLLAFDPNDRYASFQAFFAVLNNIMAKGLKASTVVNVDMQTTTGKLKLKTVRHPALPRTTSILTTEAAEVAGAAKTVRLPIQLSPKIWSVAAMLLIFSAVGIMGWNVISEHRARIAAEAVTSIVAEKTAINNALENTKRELLSALADLESVAESTFAECDKCSLIFMTMMPEFSAAVRPKPPDELLEANYLIDGEIPEIANGCFIGDDSALPQSVRELHQLWQRAYSSRIAALHARSDARKIIRECDRPFMNHRANANSLEVFVRFKKHGEVKEWSLPQLNEQAEKVAQMLTDFRTRYDAQRLRRDLGFVRNKGALLVKSCVDEVKSRVDNEKLLALKAAEERAEQARSLEIDERRLRQEQTEVAGVIEEISRLDRQGFYRILDWSTITRRMQTKLADCRTEKGRYTAERELARIAKIRFAQDLLSRHIENYVFRQGLSNSAKNTRLNVMLYGTGSKKQKQLSLADCRVTDVDDEAFTVMKPDGKSMLKVSWRKFYSTCWINFNEVVGYFIEHGREKPELSISPREWSDAMTGAALMMKLVCADISGSDKRGDELARAVIAEFPEQRELFESLLEDSASLRLNPQVFANR